MLGVFCIFIIMKKFLPLFFLLSLGVTFAAETVDGVRRQIKAVNEETAREKKLHADEKKRHEDFIKSGRDKVVSLNNQKKSLRTEIETMKAELARLNEARNKSAGVAHWYEARKQKYAQDLAKVIEELVPYFEADFPYRATETAESLKEMASELRKGVIAPDDALGRVLEVFMERIRMGYTTESWDGYLTDAETGKQMQGKYFRYGAVAAIFESADQTEYYWLDHVNGAYNWKKVPASLELRAQVKDAFRVAEGKAAPHIVRVPVPAEKVSEAETRSESVSKEVKK
jgi:molecular chaperone GrpE (heat shock protein)